MIKDIGVDFLFNGQEHAAYGDAEITTSKEDIGPCGYQDHRMAYVVSDVVMSQVAITCGGEDVKNPSKELLELAESKLSDQAEEDYDQGK